MQNLSNSPEKRLSGTAWLIRANELLGGIPEDAFDLKKVELRTIIRALIQTQGNKTLAARRLHLSKRCLYYKLHFYHLSEL